MSTNLICLTGYVKKMYWRPQGEGRSFASLSALFQFPNVNVIDPASGSLRPIGDQETWVRVGVPYVKGQKGMVDSQKGEMLAGKVEGGASNALLVGAYHVKNWKGVPTGELSVGFYDFKVGTSKVHALNHATIGGRVAQQTPPSQPGQMSWIYVEERYMVPGSPPTWKSRMIPIACSRPVGSLVGADVLVCGALSSKMLTGAPFLHVIASEIHVCP